tara:strand:+ start:422 stop:907 length:486 start_codon:yes stop_codon:yes gene_type:complete
MKLPINLKPFKNFLKTNKRNIMILGIIVFTTIFVLEIFKMNINMLENFDCRTDRLDECYDKKQTGGGAKYKTISERSCRRVPCSWYEWCSTREVCSNVNRSVRDGNHPIITTYDEKAGCCAREQCASTRRATCLQNCSNPSSATCSRDCDNDYNTQCVTGD